MRKYNVSYKLNNVIKITEVEANSLKEAREKILEEFPDAEIIYDETSSNNEMSGGLAIIVLIVLVLLMLLMPTITIFQNYVYNKFTKKAKQSGPYFEKWRLIWLILAIVFDVLLIFFIINLTAIDNSTINEILCYVLPASALGYDITYAILSYKKSDLLYPDGNSSFLFNKKKKNNNQTKTNNDIEPQVINSNTNNNDLDYQIKLTQLLKNYKELLDAGAITEEEYNEKKSEVMNNINNSTVENNSQTQDINDAKLESNSDNSQSVEYVNSNISENTNNEIEVNDNTINNITKTSKEISTPIEISKAFKITNIVLLVLSFLSLINVILLRYDYPYYDYYNGLLLTGHPGEETIPLTIGFILISITIIVISTIIVIKQSRIKLFLINSILSFVAIIMYVLIFTIWYEGILITGILGCILMLGVAIAYIVEFIKLRKQ